MPAHLRRHELHPETFIKNKYTTPHDGLTCQFCGKECKNNNSLRNHERLCKSNPDRQQLLHKTIPGFNDKGRKAWNKGLTKETDYRVERMSHSLCGIHSGRVVSFETRKKISVAIKELYACGTVGNRLHRVKHDKNMYGTYHGYECDSSWELAFVIYNLDHNIPFERNQEYFYYTFNGQRHKYFPDFRVGDKYIEIKGRVTDKDVAKFEQFPKNKQLVVIKRSEIQTYINYCKCTYGNYTELYDRAFPSYLDNKCRSGVTG